MKLSMNAVMVFNKTALAAAAVKSGVGQAVHKAAVEIRQDVHESMEEPKHGNVYLIGGKSHQASAPGEAPAVLTADLINSVKEEQVDATTWDIPAEGQEGQQMWEFGIRGPDSARPYLRPAADKARQKYGSKIKISVTNELGQI